MKCYNIILPWEWKQPICTCYACINGLSIWVAWIILAPFTWAYFGTHLEKKNKLSVHHSTTKLCSTDCWVWWESERFKIMAHYLGETCLSRQAGNLALLSTGEVLALCLRLQGLDENNPLINLVGPRATWVLSDVTCCLVFCFSSAVFTVSISLPVLYSFHFSTTFILSLKEHQSEHFYLIIFSV